MKKKKNKRLFVSAGKKSVADEGVRAFLGEAEVQLKGTAHVSVTHENTGVSKWKMFVVAAQAHVDPVLASMLFETEIVDFDQLKKIVRVTTLKKFTIFQDLFVDQRKHYQEYLDRIFGFGSTLVVEFIKIIDRKKVEYPKAQTANAQGVDALMMLQPLAESTSRVNVSSATPKQSHGRLTRMSLGKNEKHIDIDDAAKWTLTNELLDHFGGTVREIIKDTHELDA